MTTHQHLVAARNLIDREGWIQYKLHREGEGYCLVGALDAVRMTSNPFACPAYQALNETAWEIDANTGCMTYNDAPGRTKEEVLDNLLDPTIARTAPEPHLELVAEPVVELVA